MITENIKAELTEKAEEKLEELVTDAVEKKIKKELKKLTRNLTIIFAVTGVVLAGICYAIGNKDKVVVLLKKIRRL